MKEFSVIFWDFDGVIKESVAVKANAFFELFKPFGDEVVRRILEHHFGNGGMSRYHKVPIYLEWANQSLTSENIALYCEQFSCLVVDQVIQSPWVLGVENYLRGKPLNQTFILITATPQREIEYILKALDLEKVFFKVYGSPIKKSDAIFESISEIRIEPSKCLVIGDSIEDYEAAAVNGVTFLLRETEDNKNSFISYSGPSIKDFRSL
jgi:phosphoglycolate phosphatase-like HAD superfamily hydrolase